MNYINNKDMPLGLQNIPNTPKKLYYQGNINLLKKKMITIVGSRKCSDYGKHITKEIVKKYRGKDVAIVSGFANGIDSVAHLSSIENKVGTIAVIGCGLDVNYPKNTYLRSIMNNENSLILTEYDYGTLAKPYHFPMRNRILAALSECVIIVECKIKSGTMITAKYAIDIGKDVWVVPGRINDELSCGPNYLIFQGANPIYDLEIFG